MTERRKKDRKTRRTYPIVACTLSDIYSARIEECTTVGQVLAIGEEFQLDFITRVFDHKAQLSFSTPILLCTEYIKTHLGEPISLAKLCQMTNYSKSHFLKLFKKETGLTVVEFENKLKIERAKELLISNQKNLQQIAEELGFNSQSYFGKQFKKAVGVSPKQFQLGKTI